jgi:hypothetical protein
MTKAVLLRRGPFGRRAFPINKADADKMVTSGTAKLLHSNLYKEQDAVVEPVEEAVYATKVMTPKAPAAKSPSPAKKPVADKEKA